MQQYKHTPFDEETLEAMIQYNTNNPSKNHFSLIDARIISLIHSYSYSEMLFFASNKYLAERCLTSSPTVQKSINKLLDHNFITKKVACINGRKQRILSYNEHAVDQFKKEMLLAAPQAP